MNQEELFSYVYDFLSHLLENKVIFSNINQIVLFGSVVRGDFHNKSDIDLFIDTKQSKKVNLLVKKEINNFELRSEKTWFLRGVTLPLKVIVGDLSQPQWKELQEEIISYGKVLFGSFESFPEKGKHLLLLTYELIGIHQNKKMALLRNLYGYKSKKENKEYHQKGLLEEIGGRKVQANVILIPPEGWLQVKTEFKKHNIRYTLQEIWTK